MCIHVYARTYGQTDIWDRLYKVDSVEESNYKCKMSADLLNISFDSNVQVWSFHCRSKVRMSSAPPHSIPDVALHVAKSFKHHDTQLCCCRSITYLLTYNATTFVIDWLS